MEFGYWKRTIEIWHGQGLPPDCETNADVERHLGLEGISIIPTLPVQNGPCPPFEEKVIEVRGGRRIIRNEDGVLCEMTESDTSIPRYLRYTIESRADWERLRRERLDPEAPGRIGNAAAAVAEARAAGLPVRFNAGSLYGWLRNWMGLEVFSVALLTEKDWVEEMMEHLTILTLALVEKALPGLEADVAWWWEDMAYNHGPLLSPRLFRELMVPRYARITAALRRAGIEANVLDCDGRIDELVPGWLEAGINVMFPVESIHSDPLRLSRNHGDRLLMIGGVNKMALIEGRGAIGREIERLRPLVERGGYIPCVDHRVPPDVNYANYLYYLEKKDRIL
jgi:uroporphyrinogen decarboxylase